MKRTTYLIGPTKELSRQFHLASIELSNMGFEVISQREIEFVSRRHEFGFVTEFLLDRHSSQTITILPAGKGLAEYVESDTHTRFIADMASFVRVPVYVLSSDLKSIVGAGRV